MSESVESPSVSAIPAKTTAMMRRFRSRDTKPELALRREPHRRERRFFVDRAAIPGRRRADIVFPTAHVAVFGDGCFWHSCPEPFTSPKTNAEWWKAKLAGSQSGTLTPPRGYVKPDGQSVRLWEHVPVSEAADTVESALPAR